MLQKLSISKQVIFGIVLLLLIEGFFVASLTVSVSNTLKSLARERNVREVNSALHRIANISQKIGIAMIRSGSPPELLQFVESTTDYHVYLKELNDAFNRLEELVNKEPDSSDSLRDIKQLRRACEVLCNYYDTQQNFFRRSADNFESFCKKMFVLSNDVNTRCQTLIKHYRTFEQSKPADTAQALNKVQNILMVGSTLNLIFALFTAWFIVKRITTRVGILSDNVHRFSAGEPLQKRLLHKDEIGAIDALFHEMTSALIQARKNEHALIENATDVICELDRNGVFITVSSAAKKQWGYEPDDLIGKHFGIVIPSDRFDAASNQIDGLMKKGARGSFETKVELANGHRIDTVWSASWSPSAEALFCFVNNITERKKMEKVLAVQEAQVRGVIQNLPVGILTIDEEGFIKSTNETIEFMCEREQQDMIGRSIYSLFESDNRSSESVVTAIEKLSPMDTFRCSLRKTRGAQLPVDVSAAELTVSGKRNRLLVVDDVSERVKLEKMKQDFVFLLGRNLREPLYETRTRIVELRDLTPPERDKKKHERLVRLASNIDRLLRLLDELLRIEQLAPGKLVGELAPASVEDVVREAVEAVKDHAEQQGITLTHKSSPGVVLADSERLVQVIVNLLGNAIKFSPRQSTVTVSAESKDDKIEFSVTDSGRGIPDAMKESIFEQFVQVRQSDSQRGKGSGLGLSICKTIVEAHNGEIGVDSEEGQGSTFWFTIPKTDDSDK